jgi:dolichyl-phosphate-mannose--protein O-mannosyl transferase
VTKENFLTVRWNNILTLGLGLPALAYAVVALSTSISSHWAGFLGLAVIGVLY